jgi:hypothetical protein
MCKLELFGPGHFVGLGLRLKSEINSDSDSVRRSASYTINTSCEMLTSLQYKCVNKQTNTLSPSPKGFQSPKFSDSEVCGLGLGRPKRSVCNACNCFSCQLSAVTILRQQLKNYVRYMPLLRDSC